MKLVLWISCAPLHVCLFRTLAWYSCANEIMHSSFWTSSSALCGKKTVMVVHIISHWKPNVSLKLPVEVFTNSLLFQCLELLGQCIYLAEEGTTIAVVASVARSACEVTCWSCEVTSDFFTFSVHLKQVHFILSWTLFISKIV